MSSFKKILASKLKEAGLKGPFTIKKVAFSDVHVDIVAEPGDDLDEIFSDFLQGSDLDLEVDDQRDPSVGLYGIAFVAGPNNHVVVDVTDLGEDAPDTVFAKCNYYHMKSATDYTLQLTFSVVKKATNGNRHIWTYTADEDVDF